MSEAQHGGRKVLGWFLTLVGLVGLGALFAVLDMDGPAPFRLGLALTALLSGLAQVALLIGIWLLWTTRRRL